jgi:CubicO group peptidase (beta-lactamase class C family)
MLLRLTAAIALATSAALPAALAQQAAEAPAQAVRFSEAELRGDGGASYRFAPGAGFATQYEVGSIAKYACTLVALDMARDGLLSLSDPLSKLLPDYRGTRGGEITLAHLLQNRSSITDGFIAAYRADPASALDMSLSTDTAVERFANGFHDWAPGTEWDYAITNWIVVQAVLERAGGAPIAELLQTRLFGPAGMNHTRAFSGLLEGADIAPVLETLPEAPAFLTCAGGIASTPMDLIRLLRFPYRGADFSDATLRLLETVPTPAQSYAIGGRVYHLTTPDGTRHALSWQSGSNGPWKARAVYDPVHDIGYAAMTGDDDYDVLEARRDAWRARVGLVEADGD